MGQDYYKILGLERQASAEDIKQAFHKKAHQHHPDKTGGDAEKFKEINEAYQVLSNPQKRAQYDQFGSTFNQSGRGGFNGFEGMNINMDDLGDMFGGFGDIFGFGSKKRSQRQQPGHDLEVVLDLTFEEAVFGTDKAIKLNKQVVCQDCQGRGGASSADIKTCHTCQGRGYITKMQRTILGAMQMQTECPDCQGQGQTITKPCSHCAGRGVKREGTELKVKIPAGIDNGETIRLSGQGEVGAKGAPAGDLYLKIRVQPHRHFQRRGYDILSEIDINLSQAVLGDKVEVATIDGQVDLKIPSGTQSGKTFILKNRGVTKLQGRGRGDQLITIKVKIPTSLNREQKKLIEELSQKGL